MSYGFSFIILIIIMAIMLYLQTLRMFSICIWFSACTTNFLAVVNLRHGKTGQTRLTQPVWPATQLTRLKMTRFDQWPILTCNLIDPTRLFCHVYQRWIDWDWGVIFIKYLLILFYLICYILHYSLSFYACYLHFLFLL